MKSYKRQFIEKYIKYGENTSPACAFVEGNKIEKELLEAIEKDSPTSSVWPGGGQGDAYRAAIKAANLSEADRFTFSLGWDAAIQWLKERAGGGEDFDIYKEQARLRKEKILIEVHAVDDWNSWIFKIYAEDLMAPFYEMVEEGGPVEYPTYEEALIAGIEFAWNNFPGSQQTKPTPGGEKAVDIDSYCKGLSTGYDAAVENLGEKEEVKVRLWTDRQVIEIYKDGYSEGFQQKPPDSIKAMNRYWIKLTDKIPMSAFPHTISLGHPQPPKSGKGEEIKWPDLWLNKTFELRDRAHRLENENGELKAEIEKLKDRLWNERMFIYELKGEIAKLKSGEQFSMEFCCKFLEWACLEEREYYHINGRLLWDSDKNNANPTRLLETDQLLTNYLTEVKQKK